MHLSLALSPLMMFALSMVTLVCFDSAMNLGSWLSDQHDFEKSQWFPMISAGESGEIEFPSVHLIPW